jgi:hypothetical protein
LRRDSKDKDKEMVMAEKVQKQARNSGRLAAKKLSGSENEQQEFLDYLIARSGIINRLIMRFYRSIDIKGLERWYAHIQYLKSRRPWAWRLELLSYWPIRAIERVSAVFIGGSLTSAEQFTFSRICKISDYKLTRYNSICYGSLTGAAFFYSGKFSFWLGSFGTFLDMPLDLTAMSLYSVGLVSVLVDIFRAIDSFARRKAHMPFGFFPLFINSTTFIKRLMERGRV